MSCKPPAWLFRCGNTPPVIGQADAERVLGLPADQMLKTMGVPCRRCDVLVALPARSRVHYGNLARAVGVQRSVLRQAEPDDLARIGMMPGGASPVCGADGVITVFDVFRVGDGHGVLRQRPR